jgi:cytochrome b561
MSLKDTATGYGWISIALHWVTAVWIVVLLFLGNSIEALIGDSRTQAIVQHTSVAVSGYALLALRIVWRFYCGHPAPTQKQRGVAFTLGKWTHLIILVALAVMLVTGPLMVWSGGDKIVVFDWFVVPGPLPTSFALRDALHHIHATSALVIFVGILLHLGGVYKHTAFNQDGTLAKILIADRQSREEQKQQSRVST